MTGELPYTAMEMDLEVVPVLDEVDLPAADERVAEFEDIVGIDATDAVRCSRKPALACGRTRTSGARHSAAGRRSGSPLPALIID